MQGITDKFTAFLFGSSGKLFSLLEGVLAKGKGVGRDVGGACLSRKLYYYHNHIFFLPFDVHRK